MQVKYDATEGAYHPEHIKIRGGCLSFQMKLKRYVSIIQKKKNTFFFFHSKSEVQNLEKLQTVVFQVLSYLSFCLINQLCK